MRFSLFQFLLFVTSVCVVCTLFARAPVLRGIVAAFVLGGGVSLLLAKVCHIRFGQ
jgi:hypothetical protein